MSALSTRSAPSPIDPALLAEIVRRVYARLQETQTPLATQPLDVAPVKLVTAATVVAFSASGHRTIPLAPRAVITPAAQDEAKRLGLRLDRANSVNRSPASGNAAAAPSIPTATLGIVDTTDDSWAASVVSQLARRGVVATTSSAPQRIVVTDHPARQTHEYSASGSHRAVMLQRATQVERFRRELDPDVWVIDKTEVNLPVLVNIAVRIAQTTETKP